MIAQLHKLGAELCVVGDDDQSIYQWRGSQIENIIRFTDRYARNGERPVTFPIEHNFRSSPGVIDTANEIIRRIPKGNRLPKEMRDAQMQPYEAGDITALAFESVEAEAEWIAETCRSLRGVTIEQRGHRRGLTWSDMTVLVRRKRDAAPILQALRAHDVPAIAARASGLFARPEMEAIRLTFHYLAGIDIDSSKEHYPAPTRSDAQAAWLETGLRLEPTAILQGLHYLDRLSAQDRLEAVLLKFLSHIGVREDSLPHGLGTIVMAEAGRFSQLVHHYESIHYFSDRDKLHEEFAKFLYFRAPKTDIEPDEADSYTLPDAVQILTVHQAKGLEWPVVFIPSLVEGVFPFGNKSGRTVWHLLPSEAVADQKRYQTTEESERRLFYVAMTRSERFLHMTTAQRKGKRNSTPSVFWNDVSFGLHQVSRQPPNYQERDRAEPQAKDSGQPI